MLNQSETTATLLIVLVAFAVLFWGYNRSQAYGKLGMLAWLQSVVLIVPWLTYFALFVLGIYLNLVAIIFLLVASAGVYIWLGNRLRAAGQDVIVKEESAQGLENEAAAQNQSEENSETSNNTPREILPIPETDLKIIQGIFGIDTFFATETISYQEGAIFRGNLRGEADRVHSRLSQKLTERLGDKYRLFLVENPDNKPVVIVLPSSNDPQSTTLAQKNLALVLLIATIATCIEAGSILLGFDFFTELGRYREALPISFGIWAILGAHEIAHHIIAKDYNLRLSIPFFIPNWQIGCFGAITRFESLIPNRTILFDVAFAGPAVGGIISLMMLIIGLILSHPGSTFQISTTFLQGSILVGTLAKIILGTQLKTQLVDVNLLVVIGWLGLVITALNLLPAGQLDGGRIIQAIYGRKTARRSTITTLFILGIVALFNPGNPLPLYWGVIIFFLQRDLERPILNELTEPDDTRASLALLALFLVLATLIPFNPILATRLGIGI